jgi:hypothetical protein
LGRLQSLVPHGFSQSCSSKTGQETARQSRAPAEYSNTARRIQKPPPFIPGSPPSGGLYAGQQTARQSRAPAEYSNTARRIQKPLPFIPGSPPSGGLYAGQKTARQSRAPAIAAFRQLDNDLNPYKMN